jgi:hypothetical protein
MSAASNKDRCYAEMLTVKFYEHDGCQIVNFDQHSDENCTISRDNHGGEYSNCLPQTPRSQKLFFPGLIFVRINVTCFIEVTLICSVMWKNRTHDPKKQQLSDVTERLWAVQIVRLPSKRQTC